MSKTIKNSDVVTIAKNVKQTVEKEHNLPTSVKVGSVTYSYPEFAYAFAYLINHINSDVTIPSVKVCSGMTGEPMAEEVIKSDYQDQAKRIVQFITQNGQCPNYVTTVKSKKRASALMFIYAFAKIIVFYNTNKQMPNYCVYQTSVYNKNKPAPSSVTTSDEVLAYFEKVFGIKVNYIDDFFEAINNRGYSYYYDNMYTNKETIDRIKAKKGVNCTDVTHVAHNIGLALIKKGKYKKIETLHVKCSGGDGHVRSRITHTNGNVFYRDGACALSNNGRGAYCNWCSNGTLLAVNPSWFMNDLYK